MTISRRQFTLRSLAALAATRTARSLTVSVPPPKIRVLIVDGINNHDWKTATHGIVEILARTGLFAVDVSTTPPREAAPAAWDTWRPAFARYDVVSTTSTAATQPRASSGPPRSKPPWKPTSATAAA